MKFVAELLRSPGDACSQCADPTQQLHIARVSLCLIALGGATFGAAVGAYRGPFQLAASAIKLPLVTLFTLSLAGPAFYALATAFGRRWDFRRTLALMLAAGARSSLVLFALAPVLALAVDLDADYTNVRFLAVVAYGLGGLSALSFVTRALGEGPGRFGALVSFLAVFLVIGAQSAWLGRPYLGDPRDRDVPLFAHGRHEGGMLGALFARGRAE
jgi:hypothetical protein